MTKKYIHSFALFIIILLLGNVFIIGFYCGFKYLSTNNRNYNSNINLQTNQSNIDLPPTPSETFSLSGLIKTISETEITLENQPVKILINPDTQYNKIINDPQTAPPLPEQASNLSEITLSDLAVGQLVSAQAEENIKDKSEFIASLITLIINQE